MNFGSGVHLSCFISDEPNQSSGCIPKAWESLGCEPHVMGEAPQHAVVEIKSFEGRF